MTCKTFYRVNPQTDERWKSYLCDTFEELPTEGCVQGEWAIVKTPARRMFLHSGSVWEEKGIGGSSLSETHIPLIVQAQVLVI